MALTVAKRRSESRKFNAVVRLDDNLVAKAKKVAALKAVTLGEYISDAMRPIVDRDIAKEIKKFGGGLDGE